MRIERGSIVMIALDPTLGHEQRGMRPCVVVSDPDVIADQRFPLLCVIPVTGTAGVGALYPELSPGRSGLSRQSYALADQLRSVDKRRVRRAFGKITATELDAVEAGICLFLGIERAPMESVQ